MAATAVLNHQTLIGTGLFKEWSHEVFNNIKDISESRHVSLDDIAAEMGKDLQKANLNNHIGICRIHNHFKVKPNEIVQMLLGSSIDDIMAKVESNATVAHVKPVEINNGSEPAPIPYMWAFDKASQQFFPIQFFDGSNTIMQGRFIETATKKRPELLRFLRRFIDRVNTTGTEDDLGFYLRYDNLMNKQADEGFLEDTDVINRTQRILATTKEAMQHTLMEKKKVDQDTTITPTHWYFNGDLENGMIECRSHCFHCSSH